MLSTHRKLQASPKLQRRLFPQRSTSRRDKKRVDSVNSDAGGPASPVSPDAAREAKPWLSAAFKSSPAKLSPLSGDGRKGAYEADVHLRSVRPGFSHPLVVSVCRLRTASVEKDRRGVMASISPRGTLRPHSTFNLFKGMRTPIPLNRSSSNPVILIERPRVTPPEPARPKSPFTKRINSFSRRTSGSPPAGQGRDQDYPDYPPEGVLTRLPKNTRSPGVSLSPSRLGSAVQLVKSQHEAASAHTTMSLERRLSAELDGLGPGSQATWPMRRHSKSKLSIHGLTSPQAESPYPQTGTPPISPGPGSKMRLSSGFIEVLPEESALEALAAASLADISETPKSVPSSPVIKSPAASSSSTLPAMQPLPETIRDEHGRLVTEI